jgi:hypothetical protein
MLNNKSGQAHFPICDFAKMCGDVWSKAKRMKSPYKKKNIKNPVKTPYNRNWKITYKYFVPATKGSRFALDVRSC